VAESGKTNTQDIEVQDSGARETGTEENSELSKANRAGSYFREHPGVKWGLILGLIITVVGVMFVWQYYSVRESTDDAQIDGHITPISSRVSGTVIEVNFRDNSSLKAGDVLVRLDPRDYEVAVARAEAELADAQASANAARTSIPIGNVTTTNQLATANAARNAASREVDAARARLREAEANFQKVSRDLDRMKQLIAKDEISRQQFDATVAAADAARAAVDSAHAGVATAESRVAQAEAGVRTAQTAPEQVSVIRSRFGAATASVQKAVAVLQQARLNLHYTVIEAPTNGIASKRAVEVGQVVQAGQPLAALVDITNVFVTANFKETQLKDMRPGQPVKIHVDAYDREFNGHIDSIGGATGARFSLLPPENATGNYVKVVQRIPVKITLDKGEDPKHVLRPGMSVVPTVYIGK